MLENGLINDMQVFGLVDTERWPRDLELPLIGEEEPQFTALPNVNTELNIITIQENLNAIRSNDSEHNLETSKIKCGVRSINQGGICAALRRPTNERPEVYGDDKQSLFYDYNDSPCSS